MPPSAWRTSQSTVIVRSPSFAEVDDATERAPDQALDLVRSAAERPLTDSRSDRSAVARGQHRVLGGHPARALAAEVRRHAVADRRGAQDLGVAGADAARALRPLQDAEGHRDRPQVAGSAAVRPDRRRSIADAHRSPSLPTATGRSAAAARSSALAASHSCVEGREIEVAHGDATLARHPLHAPEPAPELLVRGPQRRLRLDAQLAPDVDRRRAAGRRTPRGARRRIRRGPARRAPRRPCRARPRSSASRSRAPRRAPASPGSRRGRAWTG